MHIKQIIIDGFKSYANRTVIDNWDKQFNAITGLNGSGKSNILDSICFVLGISNLSAVRAQDFKDLVYKQGQSRVTKASVTIVFDNSDRSSSPMGFEDSKEITITRQIVLGGRNKYIINGTTVQQNRVQNLFHSVSLNVNNPHFLIMQGRITKVCNMKPHELLSLIEEATGTRMYESKKAAALATLEKKQGKMDEINRILTDELLTTMTKLKDEKAKFNKWQTLSSKIERLKRFTTAATYVQLGERIRELSNALTEANEGAENCEVNSKRAKEELHKLKFLIAQEEQRRQEDHSVREADAAVQTATVLVDTREGEVQNAQEKLKKEAAAQARVSAAVERARGTVARLSQRREDKLAQLAAAEDAFLRGRDKVSALEASLVGLGGSGQEGGGLSGQLIAVQQEQGEVEGQLQSEQVKHKMVADSIAADERRLAQEEAQFRRLEQEVEAARARLQGSEANVLAQAEELCRSMNIQVKAQGPVAALRAARERLLPELQREEQRLLAAKDDYQRRNAQLAGKLSFHYQTGPGLNPQSIKGVFAKLIEVKDPSSAYALEVAAGGRLFQIVVDNSNTGKALLDQRRENRESQITIIPLAQIRAKTLPHSVLELAKNIAGDKADCAISLVNFDSSVRAAAEFVFGSTFICADNQTAERITFNRDIFTRSVTLQGDVFDPQGTLTGGSRPKHAGFLASVRELQQEEEKLKRMEETVAAMQARLNKLEELAQQWQDLEHQRGHIANLDTRKEHSTYHRVQAALAPKRAELDALKAQIDATLARKARLEARLQDLMRVSKSMEGGGKSALKSLEAELKQAKSNMAPLEQAHAQCRDDVERIELEVQSAREDADKLQAELDAMAAAQGAKEKELEEALSAVERAVQELDKVKAHLAQVLEVDAQHNAQLTALQDQRAQLNASLLQYEVDAKAFAAARKRYTDEKAQTERERSKMVKEHKWIVSDQERFNERGGDYDFQKTDPRVAAAELAQAQEEEAELGRSINRKVQAMFEQAEKEYNELLRKKDTIERDKAKIEGVIAQLDAKKREALETAWREVTSSFDSIFSILLPGANARLKKHVNAQDVIVGLEMLVAFGGVEKDSLSELSGGQRSLLALSLILALLRFKPAPMYILDEVDAALDLSHTQNIGAMLKKHFPQSQFIIVSLKEGMFNNANVLFRTKFVDGVSTVTCTRNNNIDE